MSQQDSALRSTSKRDLVVFERNEALAELTEVKQNLEVSVSIESHSSFLTLSHQRKSNPNW